MGSNKKQQEREEDRLFAKYGIINVRMPERFWKQTRLWRLEQWWKDKLINIRSRIIEWRYPHDAPATERPCWAEWACWAHGINDDCNSPRALWEILTRNYAKDSQKHCMEESGEMEGPCWCGQIAPEGYWDEHPLDDGVDPFIDTTPPTCTERERPANNTLRQEARRA